MLDLNDQIRTYYEATTAPIDVDLSAFDERVLAVGASSDVRSTGTFGETPVRATVRPVMTRWRGPGVAVAAFAVTALVFVTMLVALRLIDPDVEVLGGGGDPVMVLEADPWGLETAGLPTTQEEVTALFTSMPGEISGLARSGSLGDVHVAVVDYRGTGDEFISYSAQPGDSRDDIPPIEWLETMASAPEYDIVASSLDTSRSVVWISGSFTALEGETIYMAGWGDPNSGWLFYVEAGSADDRDAAVEAFIEAASR
jgi:hypothetical protein